MSGFMSQLDVEEVTDADPREDGRSTWRLTAPLLYASDVAKRVIAVPAGFVTDFASVPRIPVAWYLAGGESNRAAVVHDYLYTSHILARPLADAVFYEAMGVTGQSWWRRAGMWAMVRLFGEKPFEADLAKGSQ